MTQGFDDYEKQEAQLKKFIEWADYEGFELRQCGEFEFSDKKTNYTYYGYKSRQVEIDELQKRIDKALVLCEKGCVLKAMSVLKGTNK